MTTCTLCGRPTDGRTVCAGCGSACFSCGHKHGHREPCPDCDHNHPKD